MNTENYRNRENLEEGNPIDPSGFQRHCGYPALLEPIS